MKTKWVQVGNEVHDKECMFDEKGARIGETPNRICTVEYPYLDAEGQSSNARLMAAAPELLAACQDALDYFSDDYYDEDSETAKLVNHLRQAVTAC